MDIGIQCDAEVIQIYNDIKTKGTHQSAMFKLNDNNSVSQLYQSGIILDQLGEKGQTYAEFLAALPTDQPRYCVYDYHREVEENGLVRKTNKLIYIFWCPDNSKPKQKMVSATNNPSFQTKFQGTAAQLQGNDLSDISEEELLKKLH